MLSGGLLLVSGNVFSSLIVLARNVAIARLLSVEHYGVASTFVIVFTLIETLGNVAIDRLIVQAKDGDDPKLQSALHGVQIGRGVLGAIVLFAIAHPYAALMGVPEAAWAFQVFAVFPLLRGFAHLDVFRAQRAMRFGPSVAAMLVPQLLSLAAVWPLYWQFGDWRVSLWALLIQQALFLVVTHIVAARAYGVRWDQAVFRRALAFGLPLLGNGILLFAVFNGDRAIVGNQLGLAALGIFSAALMLTLTPTTVIARTLQSFFLPQLAKLQDDEAAFQMKAAVTIEAGYLAAAAVAVGFAFFGPAVLILLFGVKFAPALDILCWLAVVQAVRVAKVGPVVVAIAKGETANPLYANLVRIMFLPIAFVLVAGGGAVIEVVWAALAGELAALAVSIWRTRSRLGVSLRPIVVPTCALIGLLAAILADAVIWPPTQDLLAHAHMAQIGIVVAALGFLAALTALRRAALSYFQSARAQEQQ